MAVTPPGYQPQVDYSYAAFVLLAGIVAGELFWFSALYPLWPKTAQGWLVGALAGASLGIWAAGNALLMDWLQNRVRFRALFKVLAALVAVSLGVLLFWLAQGGQSFIIANSPYFGH